MKKSQSLLLKLAHKFQDKYAQDGQTLQQIIEAAAGYGEKSANGIMNFPAQLKADQADMTINVTKNTGMLGGFSFEVSPPQLDPAQVAANYARLPEQIKNYLEKHGNSFPQIPLGTSTLTYSGKSAEPGVAQR